MLREYAETGEKFFIQADGSAKHPSTNGAYSGVPGSGEPFHMPQDGTVLRAEPGSGYPDVKFQADNFVLITYRGLMTRTAKPKPRKGNTNAVTAVSFCEYRVEYTKGICRISGGKIQYLNTSRVVKVCLVRRLT